MSYPGGDPEVLRELEELKALHAERNGKYGGLYKSFGYTLHAMLGEVTLRTPAEHARYANLSIIVGKLRRYIANFQHGHPDSLRDIAVYCMLQLERDNNEAREDCGENR